MKNFIKIVLLILQSYATFAQSINIKILKQSVEVYKDQWGVSHIYAQNEHDLFVTQGYVAASDRLFQLEMWRRQATGTVAELLGERELKRDIGTRVFKFRGNLDAELQHYHPRSKQIIEAFVAGINAYIAEARQNPANLPFEFQILHTLPEFWTPEIVISRHQGLLGNIEEEINTARLVKLIGADKVRELSWFHPKNSDNEPNLELDKMLDNDVLFEHILEYYEAFRSPLKFPKPDNKIGLLEGFDDWYKDEKANVGSNNWIISGKLSESGYPMLANDPHRAQSTPSLRYWVHLNAPGWNVIGGGEPTLPGVSIGHNEYGAWGLTIFETDNEDLYVYEQNPKNPNQYKHNGIWKNIKIITDTIRIKGQAPKIVQLKYTHHGPIVYEDATHQHIYAVRAGWQEVGCAPYLASLRMNQAKNWEEFRKACTFSRIPGENMIWADKKGHIGWQAVGISPIRKNWSGLVPVPGDGRYEWAGYLPIELLPNKFDPNEGFVVTANNNLTPANFPNRNAIGWRWATPVRAHRIEEVLASGKKHTLESFATLQSDYVSLTARVLVPILKRLSIDEKYKSYHSKLGEWNTFELSPESTTATMYVEWENLLQKAVHKMAVPEKAQKYLKTIPTKRLTDWLVTPPPFFGANPVVSRDSILITCFKQAIDNLQTRLGKDESKWQYGQADNKHIKLTHALSDWVTDPALKAKINLGPIPRGGYGETVNNTSNNLNQTHGASFKIIVDTENWDRTLGINNPGQSGDPRSPHYGDLFNLWGKGGYFPVYFTKSKIMAVSEKVLVLKP
ncbi:peptidase S45 penicillin amidase [Emticicia oligotrophica DSM 17448]|uniref:Peptidase S45 penicillin amidase n=1 Tax=Emticicia oligotrophica (strain DSM 17448 / CIP 109782 / MTCC 6937 / GPTSA100-15) TaxID=929562 RepID=A0ABM5N095_EMTOG|nr:penicillin acylase family protein [Emticicia oligotrophica]AFK02692.1 peptidase S45 penicillin amidase [Emticicia oligotrophica DSM 17448]